MNAKPHRYAEGTGVSVERSKLELDTLLSRNGAQQRSFAQDDRARRSVVTFALGGRMIRLELTVSTVAPNPNERDYNNKAKCPHGWNSWTVERRAKWVADLIAQREREAWRRLILIVKAKLEAVAQGSTTVEREFLSDILLPDGRTVHQALAPQLEESYATRAMPPLLPPAGGAQ